MRRQEVASLPILGLRAAPRWGSISGNYPAISCTPPLVASVEAPVRYAQTYHEIGVREIAFASSSSAILRWAGGRPLLWPSSLFLSAPACAHRDGDRTKGARRFQTDVARSAWQICVMTVR